MKSGPCLCSLAWWWCGSVCFTKWASCLIFPHRQRFISILPCFYHMHIKTIHLLRVSHGREPRRAKDGREPPKGRVGRLWAATRQWKQGKENTLIECNGQTERETDDREEPAPAVKKQQMTAYLFMAIAFNYVAHLAVFSIVQHAPVRILTKTNGGILWFIVDNIERLAKQRSQHIEKVGLLQANPLSCYRLRQLLSFLSSGRADYPIGYLWCGSGFGNTTFYWMTRTRRHMLKLDLKKKLLLVKVAQWQLYWWSLKNSGRLLNLICSMMVVVSSVCVCLCVYMCVNDASSTSLS